ncbi:unannotated protein [freshwater metagenome]|uniref:Unannotated protein n=1 Tax=freshwater metagenome TaxID=449393 RepID=A0A6J6PSV2_9ZZZZ
MPKRREFPALEGPVRLGCHIVDATLEQGDRCGLGCHLRNKLNGTSSNTDHSHAMTAQILVMVPSSRVEHGSCEALKSRNLRNVWPVELSQSTHNDLGLGMLCFPRFAISSFLGTSPRIGVGSPKLKAPEAALLDPCCSSDLRRELNMRSKTVLVYECLEIVKNLGLLGELACPVNLGRKGKAVQV